MSLPGSPFRLLPWVEFPMLRKVRMRTFADCG